MTITRKLLFGLLALLVATAFANEAYCEEVALYPVGPEGIKDLSTWGRLHEDDAGRIYVSSGDHAYETGNSWLWQFDPKTKSLQLVIDIKRDAGDHYSAAGNGHGKFHVAPRAGSDGRIYITSYRSSGTEEEIKQYQGSLLFSFLPGKPDSTKCHGVIFPNNGTVAAQITQAPNGHDLYAALVKPTGQLMVYDITAGNLVYESPQFKGSFESFTRLCDTDSQGRIYYQLDDLSLHRFDPETMQSSKLDVTVPTAEGLPSEGISTYKTPKSDAVRVLKPVGKHEMLGITTYGLFFLLNTETLKTKPLGHALNSDTVLPYYVPDFAVNAACDTVYYAGGLRNKAGDVVHENPLIAFNFRTDEKRVIARLNELIKSNSLGRFRYTFGCLLSRDESYVYLAINTASGTHVTLAEIGLK